MVEQKNQLPNLFFMSQVRFLLHSFSHGCSLVVCGCANDKTYFFMVEILLFIKYYAYKTTTKKSNQVERGDKMLTKKQEEFAQNIVKGMSKIDAYKSAYTTQKMSNSAISVEASRLLKNPKVSLRIEQLRDKLATPVVMSSQDRLEYLTRLVNEQELETVTVIVDGTAQNLKRTADFGAKLKAIDLMNKMTGEYVTKVEGSMNVKLEDLL